MLNQNIETMITTTGNVNTTETKIGLRPEQLAESAEALNRLLADEHVLYVKTRNAHWNVEDRDFHALHKFFEEQYTALEGMIDEVAERVRNLGHYALGSMTEFLEVTHLSEDFRSKNDGPGYIKALLLDHEAVIINCRKNIDQLQADQGTADFITGLMEQHEKMAWMLRAHLR